MDIHEIQVFNAPNVFSLREPVVKMQVKLGEFAETPTKDIGNINEMILKFFPGVKDHKCATGYVGGFVDRLREGTYLAHVTEHLCLELQRVLGHDMRYGKARQVEGDLYNVIYACPHTSIGKACGITVVNALNSFIEGREFLFEEELKKLKGFCTKYDLGPSTCAIVAEAKRRGIPVSVVEDGKLVRLGYGKYQKYISATLYEGSSSIAVDIACDKSLTKSILHEVSVPTPIGTVCMTEEDAVLAANHIGYPVVVKPKSGNQGKHVFVNITNEGDLKAAFHEALPFDKEVIVEKCIEGKDYRILVVGGKTVAAAERVPAHVVGNGMNTVQELVDTANANEDRGNDHEKPLTKIKIDTDAMRILEKQGLQLSSIPDVGQKVWIHGNANLSTGGEAYDCTENIHPKNAAMAELAAKTIGLDIAGIDMVIPDIRQPIGNGVGAIVEVNAAPGIRMHLFPSRGEKRDVVSPILDMIFPEGTPASIPVIAITGTNGKTTTTRMISRILMERGLKVGTTTTHGIYINDTCVEEGDTTGPSSARRILNDRTVDVAVLETARGGIVRDGLAYEKADVAVFTNLSEDHLGVDGIHSLEELLKVKSLVIEAVKDSGTCILNADDPWLMQAKEKAKGKILLFSLDKDNPYIKEHISRGGDALFLMNRDIYLYTKGFTNRILGVDEIPATMDGALRHNVQNSMAAIGACLAVGSWLSTIRKVLRSFKCDSKSNPGRFNVYDMGDFKVVLDYGHNMDGYRVTIEGLKNLEHERLIGVIGVPGDRKDEDMKKVGRLSGEAFDFIFIKEDQDLRGREPLEVANILLSGALEGGIPESQTEIIPNEAEALKKAIATAKSGDIIVVFFEKLEPLTRVVEEVQGSRQSVSFSEELPVLA
ncbi:MAG: cyanophycin synthetase [Clostridia bacterium]|nr:cyanophycin synthetase [Clostridia bacterium]